MRSYESSFVGEMGPLIIYKHKIPLGSPRGLILIKQLLNHL
ncbi:hypothetical protein JIMMER1_44 [Brevibacillus phage Jimmer1]|uniref:Uncharacterized protein n=4 Tax=Jimmervirus TaxID=1984788 RepID=S5M9K6_9CAUD|nr:hypothetical protein AVV10_gp046 [Brevibacillus phage Osiris]YP_009226354.1 hypothetical protein AXJ21_gp044 [Brevibacillus phage Jimmer1]YP_009606471.1 hypothetical protein FDI01_gp044 [Brevibacillus phage Jimmer2]ALA48056.1 hypothetical protein POWDER_46 [Brevibacillus phage Powder]AGR47233.1 hypothetical protein JIMMER2_44 [Brevibacillus phage Jimmer2]AGR47333.1 hypothetical protein JIMMER1_44 [Brevibacillus phage Jimmer1]ALA07340.1 hypothetical protein OSIRIS_46 [Brevibacillus phage Os